MLAIRRQSAEVRVGIVGTGFIGRIHARAARQAGARLVGVAGADLANATEGRRVDPEQGGPGRTIGDIGSHGFDLVEFVTGDRITRLCAQTSVVVPRRMGGGPVLTEDLATVQFATASGALGSVAVSQVAPGRKNRLFLEVSAAAGSLAFDQENPEQLWLGGRSGSQALVRDPLSLSKAGSPGSP
ncbi:Gfo/Idh/MocA family protein [Streptomyces sp. CB02261]|uniref:Gfo/Idh/MocA family protein n=1 Tax=Streptomyces sp. CB02261 TaxID=1703940 RepID=UPI000A50D21B